MSLVGFTLELGGDVSSFTPSVQTQMQSAVAVRAGVDTSAVEMTISPGSVIADVSIQTTTAMAASVQSTMASATSSPSSATAMLASVTGVSIAVLAIVTPPTVKEVPPPPPPMSPIETGAVAAPTVESSGSTGVVIGVIVCVIIALVLALVFLRRRCYKPPPKTTEPASGIPLKDIKIGFDAKAAAEAKAAEAKVAADRAAAAARAVAERAAAERAAAARAVAERAAAERAEAELLRWKEELTKNMANTRARLSEAQGRVRLLAAVATNEDESLRDATKVRDEARATLVRVLDDALSAHHKGEVERWSLTAEAAALQQQQQQGGCGLKLTEQVWLMGSDGL